MGDGRVYNKINQTVSSLLAFIFNHPFYITPMGNCESIDQSKIHIPRQGPVSEILITNHVWSKKYQGLYDYQAQETTKRKLRVQGNATVIKQGEKLIIIDEKMDKLTKGLADHVKSSVFKLIRSQNYYQVVPIVYEERGELVQKPIWMVVKSLPNKVYSLREKDVIKLGKQKLKVREVVPMDNTQSVVIANKDNIKLTKSVYHQLNLKECLSQGEEEPEVKEGQGKEKEQVSIPIESTKTIGLEEPVQENMCRICLQPGLLSNPLITPCKCIGSVRYIHLLCLKQWLSKQIKAVINDFSVTINWKPLICQMCKTHYKYRIYLDNQKFYTVDIPKPEKPYIVLEIMKKKNKEEGKIFKFITFKNKSQINIGRKKDVDVRISEDISVSRIHAILKYKHETREFTLEDNHSKFGTLVIAKTGMLIRPHHQHMGIQIGAELYEFEALREATSVRFPQYQLGETYLREEREEESEEEEDAASEEDDEVLELPVDDADRSPVHMQRPLRRSQSLQAASREEFH